MKVERIETKHESENINSYTVIKKPPTQKTVNTLLIAAAVIIMIAVIGSYFVKDLGVFADISLKEITYGGLWVALGCFSFSEIVKKISLNRAKLTKEYIKVKEKTDSRLLKYSNGGYLVYAEEYCVAYADNVLKEDRKYYLDSAKIEYKCFINKYVSKSFLYLLKDKTLTMKQRWAIFRASTVKKIRYNPNFLRTTVHQRRGKSPSAMYDTQKKNMWNTITSFCSSLLSGIFAFTIAQDLVLDFSIATVIEVGIKVAVIVMTSAFRASFAWSLITETEVSRLELQQAECKACIKWSMKEYPEYFKGLTDPFVDEQEDENKEGKDEKTELNT